MWKISSYAAPALIAEVHILTFDMMKCFKSYRICVNISYHILKLVKLRKIKFTMEQPYMLPMLQGQYQACWFPDDLRNQGISRRSNDPISQNILSSASNELKVGNRCSGKVRLDVMMKIGCILYSMSNWIPTITQLLWRPGMGYKHYRNLKRM